MKLRVKNKDHTLQVKEKSFLRKKSNFCFRIKTKFFPAKRDGIPSIIKNNNFNISDN
jgi:hypothetical protein